MKKLLFLPAILIIASCASVHSVPVGEKKTHAIEYCGGELWGHFLPLGPREKGSFLKQTLVDSKPLMALFLHMHSVLEKEPEHSLTLHFALRSKEDLSIQFSEPIFSVQIDGGIERNLSAEFFLVEDALPVDQLYPSTSYSRKLIDAKSNSWRIAKRNSFFKFVLGKPAILELPISVHRKLSTEPVSVKFEDKKYDQIFVLSSLNIWPKGEPLKNSSIIVRVPSFVLNGETYSAQTFDFEMNYEQVKQHRSSYGRCPSTEEIFRFND